MSNPYIPQPGTFPARAVAHLQALPPGTELSSAVLADELGQPQGANIQSLLVYARQRGALKARREGRVLFWSLGDGTPEAKPDDYEPDAPLHKTPAAPAATVAPATPFQPPPVASRVSCDPRHFRAGLFTDGKLEIEAGSALVVLQPDEVEQLARLIAHRGGQA